MAELDGARLGMAREMLAQNLVHFLSGLDLRGNVRIQHHDVRPFGIALGVNTFGICRDNLRNVPAAMPNTWAWPTPAPSLPQQYFFSA